MQVGGAAAAGCEPSGQPDLRNSDASSRRVFFESTTVGSDSTTVLIQSISSRLSSLDGWTVHAYPTHSFGCDGGGGGVFARAGGGLVAPLHLASTLIR